MYLNSQTADKEKEKARWKVGGTRGDTIIRMVAQV